MSQSIPNSISEPFTEIATSAEGIARAAVRKYVELSPEKAEEIRRAQQIIKAEIPELILKGRLLDEAAQETTFSGELRRRIHAKGISLQTVAERIGTSSRVLDEFLTGERTLRSDVIDRLTMFLGCTLQQQAPQQEDSPQQQAPPTPSVVIPLTESSTSFAIPTPGGTAG